MTRVTALVAVTKSRNDFPNLARLHDADQPQKYFRFVNCADPRCLEFELLWTKATTSSKHCYPPSLP